MAACIYNGKVAGSTWFGEFRTNHFFAHLFSCCVFLRGTSMWDLGGLCIARRWLRKILRYMHLGLAGFGSVLLHLKVFGPGALSNKS